MKATLNQAREYVERAKLPVVEPWAGIRTVPAEAGAPLDSAKDQASVVGTGIVSFMKGVTEERRKAIANACLLAQLVANGKADPQALQDWYEAYFTVLENIGWVVQGKTEATYHARSDGFTAHEAILAVASTLLGSAPTALAVVKTTLDSLKSMDPDNPWITIFNRESRRGKTAHFQVSLVDEQPDGQFLVSLMAFGLEASQEVTQVLFFTYRTNEATLHNYSGSVTLDPTVLDGIGPDLGKKLVQYSSNYILTLDLKQPVTSGKVSA
jgi:hypothetical protein